MHRRKIGFVAGQQQGVFVEVQPMLVGSHQQGDSCQGGLRQNLTVVLFGLGRERGLHQALGEPDGDGQLGGGQSEGLALPDAHSGEGETGDFPLRRVWQRGEKRQLRHHRRRHKQGIVAAGKLLLELVGKILLPSEIEQEISVQRQ